jgi:hypothetical protein
MAKKALTYDEQIKEQQQIVWAMAEEIDVEKLKNVERIFHSGLVFEESEIMLKMFKDNSVELRKDYLLLLNEARMFYRKILKQQQIA